MQPTRVYLVKGDQTGWAIDVDRAMTRASLAALPERVTLVDELCDAEVVHAVWWEPLMELPRETIAGKRVLCHIEGDPRLRLSEPAFAAVRARVDHWIAQSHDTQDFLTQLNMPCSYVPYAVDIRCFASPPEPPNETITHALDALPADAYTIANFHRDTIGESYSQNALAPKHEKGPDVFAQVLGLVRARGVPAVALLAGPRRHWLRAQLETMGVPFVFAGQLTPGDDYDTNILPLEQLAHLYQACDLHLICSRHEGGPRGVLEAAAAGCTQLSTPVGITPDVLPRACLFTDVVEAADAIFADYKRNMLSRFAPTSHELVCANMTTKANEPRWIKVYEQLRNTESDTMSSSRERTPMRAAISLRDRPRRISFWNEFHDSPWGGGNKFMRALKAACEGQGIEITINGQGEPATAHLLSGCCFDVEAFEKVMAAQRELKPRVVQRLDALMNLNPGLGLGLAEPTAFDTRSFDLNNRYAHATVIPSASALSALAQGGYTPVRPVIIHNAVDPDIFYPAREALPVPGKTEPLRIVAASWSKNPGKGAAIYQWLDAWAGKCASRWGDCWQEKAGVSLTFVGRINSELQHWKTIEAKPSTDLAAIYRQHHVYLTASRDDPCSNALIEAQVCGLPAVYFASGGHPEIVEFGGVPFTNPAQLPAIFARLHDTLHVYRAILNPPTMRDVVRRYLQLLLGDRAYGE